MNWPVSTCRAPCSIPTASRWADTGRGHRHHRTARRRHHLPVRRLRPHPQTDRQRHRWHRPHRRHLSIRRGRQHHPQNRNPGRPHLGHRLHLHNRPSPFRLHHQTGYDHAADCVIRLRHCRKPHLLTNHRSRITSHCRRIRLQHLQPAHPFHDFSYLRHSTSTSDSNRYV